MIFKHMSQDWLAGNTSNMTKNMGLVGNADGVIGSWKFYATNEVPNGFICKKGLADEC